MGKKTAASFARLTMILGLSALAAPIPHAYGLNIVTPNDDWIGGTSDWTAPSNWNGHAPWTVTNPPTSEFIEIQPIGGGGGSGACD